MTRKTNEPTMVLIVDSEVHSMFHPALDTISEFESDLLNDKFLSSFKPCSVTVSFWLVDGQVECRVASVENDVDWTGASPLELSIVSGAVENLTASVVVNIKVVGFELDCMLVKSLAIVKVEILGISARLNVVRGALEAVDAEEVDVCEVELDRISDSFVVNVLWCS